MGGLAIYRFSIPYQGNFVQERGNRGILGQISNLLDIRETLGFSGKIEDSEIRMTVLTAKTATTSTRSERPKGMAQRPQR